MFSFFCVASESFGPVGAANGKVLLNGPYANTYNDVGASLFGVIIIAAIFGPSILRDFQRDTYQMVFTKPVSKAAYLGGRWAGSFVTTVFVFAGMLVGTWLERSRRGPTTRGSVRTICGGTSSRFFRSTSSRSSSWDHCSSPSRRSPARSSSCICRASLSSSST